MRRSSTAGGKNKKAKNATPERSPNVVEMSTASEPVPETVEINDDGEANDYRASLHRRRRPSPDQQNAQSVELATPTEDDASALLREFDVVKDAN